MSETGRRSVEAPRTIASALLASLLVGCAAAPPADETGGPVRVHVERIARLSKDYRRGSLASSRDQRRVGWVAQASGGAACRLVIDGVPGPERRACSAPVFAADGSRAASWVTTLAAPGASVVSRLVIDASPVGPDLADSGDVRLAEGGGWVASALLAPPPEGVPSEAPRMRVFGPAGDLGTFRDTSPPVLDLTGRHAAWVASDASGRRALFVDGREERDFGLPAPGTAAPIRIARPGPNLEPEETVRWLSDGTLVGIVPSGLGWLVFRARPGATGETLRDFAGHDVLWRTAQPPPTDPASRARGSALLSGSLATAAQAPVACWWERPAASGDGRWRVACNGEPADDATCLLPGTTPIAIAPGGKSFAYACVDATSTGTTGLFVVARGRRTGPHHEVATITVADGGQVAYAARDTADSAFFYVVDGRRTAMEWDEVFAPRFSPDGRHVAWGARPDAKRPRVDLVLDGRVRTRVDLVAAPPRVEDDGSASWIVRRGRNVLRIAMARGIRGASSGGSEPPDTAGSSGPPSLP
jgi:hypothetical protein